jgi:hypothetical protein
MVDASTAETPSAASPATDEAVRETEVLSGLTKLALEMARTFQAQALAALTAGDLDRAGKAEARFSTLFLAIRRAVALQLRRWWEDAAASPAADEAAMLSELMELAEELARGFHALALAALAAGDLDRAGDGETRFSSLFSASAAPSRSRPGCGSSGSRRNARPNAGGRPGRTRRTAGAKPSPRASPPPSPRFPTPRPRNS